MLNQNWIVLRTPDLWSFVRLPHAFAFIFRQSGCIHGIWFRCLLAILQRLKFLSSHVLFFFCFFRVWCAFGLLTVTVADVGLNCLSRRWSNGWLRPRDLCCEWVFLCGLVVREQGPFLDGRRFWWNHSPLFPFSLDAQTKISNIQSIWFAKFAISIGKLLRHQVRAFQNWNGWPYVGRPGRSY